MAVVPLVPVQPVICGPTRRSIGNPARQRRFSKPAPPRRGEFVYKEAHAMGVITGFGPIWDADCLVLVLGSMPSIKSLEESQYYAHPRNAFWPIMCELLGGAPGDDYAARARMLTRHGIALWDVCRCCERLTSSDSMIRAEVPNDVAALAGRMRIGTVLLNGGTAAALYRRHIALDARAVRLPSTSPAYTLPYERKKAAWREALREAGIDAI